MIQIKPAWEGEKSEDIWSLYYFLLYKTLPFPPSAYLPNDGIGFYYYPNGDRTADREYVTEPRVKWSLHQSSRKFLRNYWSVINEYCQSNPTIFCSQEPSSTHELIFFVSKALHEMIYNTDLSVNRDGLLQLLNTIPNQKTVEAMVFPLNPDLLAVARKQNVCTKKFKHQLLHMLYTEVFNYDDFSQDRLFSKLIQLLNVSVCPYCNRTFTTTVQKNDGTYHRQNQVDHYAPKSVYPWFALSLANFVPACANCNQKKSDTGEFVLYPYEESFGNAYRFRSTPISGFGYLIGQPLSNDEFELRIEKVPGIPETEDPDFSAYRKRVQNSINRLGLDVLYRECHNEYVIGIYKQHYVFNDDYIDSLMKSFPHLFNNKDDVRKLLYLKDFDTNSLGKVPLSKLTHDIDEEITFQKAYQNSLD